MKKQFSFAFILVLLIISSVDGKSYHDVFTELISDAKNLQATSGREKAKPLILTAAFLYSMLPEDNVMQESYKSVLGDRFTQEFSIKPDSLGRELYSSGTYSIKRMIQGIISYAQDVVEDESAHVDASVKLVAFLLSDLGNNGLKASVLSVSQSNQIHTVLEKLTERFPSLNAIINEASAYEVEGWITEILNIYAAERAERWCIWQSYGCMRTETVVTLVTLGVTLVVASILLYKFRQRGIALVGANQALQEVGKKLGETKVELAEKDRRLKEAQKRLAPNQRRSSRRSGSSSSPKRTK